MRKLAACGLLLAALYSVPTAFADEPKESLDMQKLRLELYDEQIAKIVAQNETLQEKIKALIPLRAALAAEIEKRKAEAKAEVKPEPAK